jgi:redox-sensitive bicupin YhaK (pirin superfamily)
MTAGAGILHEEFHSEAFTRSGIFSSPPLRVKASEWNSSCRIPAPAVIHCTSPGPIRGVGEHPHRGFETVTIVYAGEVEHRDSTGRGGVILPAGKVYGPA